MKNLALFLALVLFLACGSEKQTAAKITPSGTPAQTATVTKQPATVQIYGTLKAADVAQLAGRSGGFILKIAVNPGASVKKGDLLVVIDDRNVQAQDAKLKAAALEIEDAILEGQAQLQAAESQRQLAANTFQRIEQLYSKKAASKQEFEEAQARRDAAEAGWKAATQRLAQAQSRKKQLQSDVSDVAATRNYFRIVAPFDGIVSAVTTDEGTFANAGQPVITIENPRHYQLVFSADENMLPLLKRDSKFTVHVPSAFPDPLSATISEINPAVDSVTRTFLVKADVPGDSRLRSGYSGYIEVPNPAAKSLWIPSNFLQRNNDLETVWVKQPQGWGSVLVKSGKSQDGKVEILSGLNEGDEIGAFEVAS